MSNLTSILDRTQNEIERPKPIPAGTYTFVIKGLPERGKSKQKGTPFIEYTLQAISASDDVDADELKDWMKRKDGTSRALSDYTTKATFYTTEEALYRLTDFFKHCGIDEDDERTLSELAETVVGSQVMGYIAHEPSKDGSTIYARLNRTAAIE